MTRLARHSARSFQDELTWAGYKNIPVSWGLTEIDLAGSPEFQRSMIGTIEQAGGQSVDVTGINAGHMANRSNPKAVIQWIVSVAGKS